MRRIRRLNRFKKDYRREMKGRHGKTLAGDLQMVLQRLVSDVSLPEAHRDHGLGGQWHGHRDCHLKPDLVLIYAKPNDQELVLVRLGSHSELGL